MKIVKNSTLALALAHYKQKVSILKKGYEQERYRLKKISDSFLGNKKVSTVTSVDIATYRDQRLQAINERTMKPISAATVRLELSLLSNFFDIAKIEWGLCNSNPVVKVRKPKAPPGRDRRLTTREDRQILRYCFGHTNKEFYSIVVIALETAMRQGEILGLHWENINLRSRIAHLPETKNGSKRDVPLSIKARDALIRLGPKPKGKVFTYTSNGLKSTWRFMIQKLKIVDPPHFHDLRHEAVSRLFELGTFDIMEVAAISGHKSLSMLKRYTHLKAARLVKKLEGIKHKGKQAILDCLVPYPATLHNTKDWFQIKLLDFDNLVARGSCKETAIENAQNTLLRFILQSMRASKKIPLPDQYLELVNEKNIIMIDPLGASYTD
ncbi:site-specific integrase [Polynucleobacter sp. 86C-FISCH]|uniref:site-specific integrase n=1 Tax=Polynucleobacter sp. 86C-FISCH TaxID=2689101 RepID=UPI001C0CE4AA|nr:site-specific integrase [Polynucleobacter sp. 86C-FISCH]MBU3595088.1 site-specific integrase [Polynucleobacter sp. 86C-FISCH]